MNRINEIDKQLKIKIETELVLKELALNRLKESLKETKQTIKLLKEELKNLKITNKRNGMENTYVEILYDKNNKTQRFVLFDGKTCWVRVEKTLKEHNVPFTHHLFAGVLIPGLTKTDFKKNKTYIYAQKWQWLNAIDLRNKINILENN